MSASAWMELALVLVTVIIAAIAGTWAIIKALSSLLHRQITAEVTAPVSAIQASVAEMQAGMKTLTRGQVEHGERLVQLETAMRMNGCMDPDGTPVCGRKR